MSRRRRSACLADQEPVQCAIVDVNLGDGPNFDAARALVRQGVPVILVTGYDREVIPADLSDVRWLSKPANGRELVAQVVLSCRL